MNFVSYTLMLALIFWHQQIECVKPKKFFSIEAYETGDPENAIVFSANIPALKLDAVLKLFQKSDTDYHGVAIINEPFTANLETNARIVEDESFVKIIDVTAISESLIFVSGRTKFRPITEHDFEITSNVSINILPTDMQVNYQLTFLQLQNCPNYYLSHNITTVPNTLLYFSSNVSDTCHSNRLDERSINITLESQVWPLANLQLHQIFKYKENDGWESMNMSHTLLDIGVSAEWDDIANFHFKKASLISKLENIIPNMKVYYSNVNQNTNLNISFAKQVANEKVYRKTCEKDYDSNTNIIDNDYCEM